MLCSVAVPPLQIDPAFSPGYPVSQPRGLTSHLKTPSPGEEEGVPSSRTGPRYCHVLPFGPVHSFLFHEDLTLICFSFLELKV
jgi:hypothetical protein